MDDHEFQFPDEHEFCCKRPRGCPFARLEAEKNVVIGAPSPELEWSENERGAVATMRLTPEQATELRKWLVQKGF